MLDTNLKELISNLLILEEMKPEYESNIADEKSLGVGIEFLEKAIEEKNKYHGRRRDIKKLIVESKRLRDDILENIGTYEVIAEDVSKIVNGFEFEPKYISNGKLESYQKLTASIVIQYLSKITPRSIEEIQDRMKDDGLNYSKHQIGSVLAHAATISKKRTAKKINNEYSLI